MSTENIDTSGFYRLYQDTNSLLFAPHFVTGPNFEIVRENKDSYSYPVEGWYWFNNEQEAKIFFNLE